MTDPVRIPELDLLTAMVEDIESTCDLPAHGVLPVGRVPRIILPDECPILAAVIEAKETRPSSTHYWESHLIAHLRWHVAAVTEAQTLIQDPALAEAIWGPGKQIEARVRSWSRDDAPLGVEDVEEVQLIGVQTLEFEDGLVEGIAVVVDARMSEA